MKNQLFSFLLISSISILSVSGSYYTYDSLNYFPLTNYSGYFTIDVYDSYSYYTMIPIFYSTKSFFNQNGCGQFQNFYCYSSRGCQQYSNTLNEEYAFINMIGTSRSLFMKLSLPGLWGGTTSSQTVGYSTQCSVAQNSKPIGQYESPYGILGLSRGSSQFTASEFTIWMGKTNYKDGYLVSGWDEGFSYYSYDSYVTVSNDWGQYNNFVLVGNYYAEQQVYRYSYFDLSTPYIWLPESIAEEVIRIITKNYATSSTVTKLKYSYQLTLRNSFYNLPTIKIGSIKLAPAAYLRYTSYMSYEIMIARYNQTDVTDASGINSDFNGSILVGSHIFSYYVGRFSPSRTVRLYQGNFNYIPTNPPLPKSNGWKVVVGIVSFLLFIGVIVVLVKLCQKSNKGKVYQKATENYYNHSPEVNYEYTQSMQQNYVYNPQQDGQQPLYPKQ